MRKICLLFAVIIIATFNVAGQSRYWVGGATGLWSNTANWSLTSGGGSGASVPTVGNDVIFDNATPTVVEMDILTSPITLDISSLYVTNNANVNLQRTQAGGGTRTIRVSSVSMVTPGLKIDAGATLTIESVNTTASGTLNYVLSLTGSTATTGEIYGSLFFKGSNTGDNAFLDLYVGVSNNANLIVKNTGIVKYFIETGNTDSDPSGTFLTMESGSVYEINKNGGSLPEGSSWNDNSTVLITGTTTSGISFRQQNYGSLIWNTPGMTSATQLITTASPPYTNISLFNLTIVNTNTRELRLKTGNSSPVYDYTIRGNFENQSSGVFAIAGNSVTTTGIGAMLHLKGNFINAGTFKSDGAAGTVNDLELNGTSPQSITNTGTVSGAELDFIINNSAGAQLLSPLNLPGTTSNSLQLINGKITTSSVNLLTMIAGSGYTGGSSASFVKGPIKKIGNTSFSFPVGIGSIYSPISVVNVSGENPTDAFTAEYKRINPQSIHGAAVAPGMNHVSYVEYWALSQDVGAATKKVSLTINPESFCNVLASTYVSRWNGSLWTSEGATNGGIINVPPYQTGTITSVNNLSSFGNFSLITDLPFTSNALPIKLISFNAVKVNSGASSLTWELATCCSRDAKFEIEKSAEGRSFSKLVNIPGSETNRFYQINDTRLGRGVTYYRLKMIDTDGKANYSKVIVVINDNIGLLITNFAPNPVRDNITVSLSAAKRGTANFTIFDITGRPVKQWQATIAEGSNNIMITTDGISSGIYHLAVATADSKTVIRFVKQ